MKFFNMLWEIARTSAIVIFLFIFVLLLTEISIQTSDLTSLGVYKFNTTGEIVVKEETRKRGSAKHPRWEKVTKEYIVYVSENGEYRFDDLVTSTNKTVLNYIKNGKSVYSIEREVWQDKRGKLSFKELGYEVLRREEAVKTYRILILILVICVFTYFLANKKIKASKLENLDKSVENRIVR